jgi:hypothetical protein
MCCYLHMPCCTRNLGFLLHCDWLEHEIRLFFLTDWSRNFGGQWYKTAVLCFIVFRHKPVSWPPLFDFPVFPFVQRGIACWKENNELPITVLVVQRNSYMVMTKQSQLIINTLEYISQAKYEDDRAQKVVCKSSKMTRLYTWILKLFSVLA